MVALEWSLLPWLPGAAMAAAGQAARMGLGVPVVLSRPYPPLAAVAAVAAVEVVPALVARLVALQVAARAQQAVPIRPAQALARRRAVPGH